LDKEVPGENAVFGNNSVQQVDSVDYQWSVEDARVELRD
jgi:hypothetical protein